MAALTKSEKKELCERILKGFPDRDRLEQLVDFGLDINLNEISDKGSLRADVFNLIKSLESNGRISELLAAIPNANSDPELERYCNELSITIENRAQEAKTDGDPETQRFRWFRSKSCWVVIATSALIIALIFVATLVFSSLRKDAKSSGPAPRVVKIPHEDYLLQHRNNRVDGSGVLTEAFRKNFEKAQVTWTLRVYDINPGFRTVVLCSADSELKRPRAMKTIEFINAEPPKAAEFPQNLVKGGLVKVTGVITAIGQGGTDLDDCKFTTIESREQ